MADFFEDVTQTPRALSEGSCDLPILYRDASIVGVFWNVDIAPAREVLAGATIEPWPLLGRAVVAIYAWEYRDSSVGSYGEVGLGIQARRKGSSPSLLRLGLDMKAQEDQGIWVVSLPVTTRDAYRAGVEIWGYPKYVTPIETRFHETIHVRLGDELSLEVAPIRGPESVGLPVVTYTEKEGVLLRTVIEVDHRVRWGLGGGTKLEILGSGRTADAAKALGLADKRPNAVFRTDGFRAKLPAGVALGPIRE